MVFSDPPSGATNTLGQSWGKGDCPCCETWDRRIRLSEGASAHAPCSQNPCGMLCTMSAFRMLPCSLSPHSRMPPSWDPGVRPVSGWCPTDASNLSEMRYTWVWLKRQFPFMQGRMAMTTPPDTFGPKNNPSETMRTSWSFAGASLPTSSAGRTVR